MYIYIYTRNIYYLDINIYEHIRTMNICTYTHIYIYIYIYAYTCIYIYIYI